MFWFPLVADEVDSRELITCFCSTDAVQKKTLTAYVMCFTGLICLAWLVGWFKFWLRGRNDFFVTTGSLVTVLNTGFNEQWTLNR